MSKKKNKHNTPQQGPLVACPLCKKSFSSETALAQHTQAIHGRPSQATKRQGLPLKKMLFWTALVLGVALLGYALYWGASGTIQETIDCQGQDVTTINIGSHQNVVNHIHQDLTIIIDGAIYPIPANIGVGQDFMRPVHTHESDGELHVEGPCVRDFTLGEFFAVWGKPFSADQLLDKTSGEGVITMEVDGEPSDAFDSLVLRDGQHIVLRFTSSQGGAE